MPIICPFRRISFREKNVIISMYEWDVNGISQFLPVFSDLLLKDLPVRKTSLMKGVPDCTALVIIFRMETVVSVK